MPAKLRYIRVQDYLEDSNTVVVRGGLLDREVIRRDALRMHQVYGVYGISVFAVRDVGLDELAQQVPLVRFPVLTVIAVGAIRAADLWIDPTGRNRLHYTVSFSELDEGVRRLCAVEHEIWKNPYHEQ